MHKNRAELLDAMRITLDDVMAWETWRVETVDADLQAALDALDPLDPAEWSAPLAVYVDPYAATQARTCPDLPQYVRTVTR